MMSSNNARLPSQIKFGWLQFVCVYRVLIVNIYLIFKKNSNLISKYATQVMLWLLSASLNYLAIIMGIEPTLTIMIKI